jgi:hypothetical protein
MFERMSGMAEGHDDRPGDGVQAWYAWPVAMRCRGVRLRDHVFTVLHPPQLGQRGHVHYVELDQFIGRNYLVTVHGPLNPAVNP